MIARSQVCLIVFRDNRLVTGFACNIVIKKTESFKIGKANACPSKPRTSELKLLFHIFGSKMVNMENCVAREYFFIDHQSIFEITKK